MLHFEQELEALKQRLLAMAARAETAVHQATEALTWRDSDLARTVILQDRWLDQDEKELDEISIDLLAKAPLASDLRLITVAMKTCHELERVGDEAKKIAKRALELNLEPPIPPTAEIPRLAAMATAALREALDAFAHGDAERARALIPKDKAVDALNRQLHSELAHFMVAEPGAITCALDLMAVAKSLERIADHAKNVAEEVVYLREAQDIRHPRLAADRPEPPAEGPSLHDARDSGSR